MSDNNKPTEEQLQAGSRAFETVCSAIEELGLKCDIDEDEMRIHLEVAGEDMPINIMFFVHPDREIVRMISPMPYIVPKERRLDMAVALTFVNTRLINGSYDLDMKTGNLRFRLVESYAGSELGTEAIKYLIIITNMTEDDYNDKLIMLNKNIINLKKFVSLITADDEDEEEEGED